LLKVLTAFKLGRSDLIMKPTTFETSRYFDFRTMFPYLARNSGFIIIESEREINRRKKI